GLDRLEALMSEVLPVDATTRTEAHVVVGFWGRLAALAPAPDAGAPTAAPWHQDLADAIEEAVADGELQAATPRADLLALLRAVTYGQQIVEVTEPQPPAAHRAVLAAVLAPWRTTGAPR
uniref:TetR family transcriptional regulator C-terminal domain-containing protein n=1 Tax=Microbacterium resistens TaxID=156977 RepID=UPI000A93E8D6